MIRFAASVLVSAVVAAGVAWGQDFRRDADRQPAASDHGVQEIPVKKDSIDAKRAWLRAQWLREFQGTGRDAEIDKTVNKMSAYRINKLLDAYRKRPQVLQQMMQSNARAQQAQMQAYRNYVLRMQQAQLAAARYRNPYYGRRVIGYAPVIAWLPSGTSLGVSGVVSADRRHVRIGASPFFSNVTRVDTFNMATGETRTIHRDNRWHR